MQSFLWTLAWLGAYIVGLILMAKTTPRLILRSYDDVWFMSFAALDILGALLIFGAVVLLLAIWNGNVGIRSLDFILLVVFMLITGRLAFSCFRNEKPNVRQVSRYGAGIFCLFLSLAAIFYIVQLFKP